MADYTSSPQAGYSAYATAPTPVGPFTSNRLTGLTNAAGALVSLALVAGVGVWGYKLMVRDVSGIPVVQAATGEMRVRPEDPGGQLAQHQGLSVNEVAAEGIAAAPADRLRLAPEPVDLEETDKVVEVAMVAPVQQATPEPKTTPVAAQVPQVDVAAALNSGAVDDLVAQLTQGVKPLENRSVDVEKTDPEQVVATVTDDVITSLAAASTSRPVVDAPGVRQSIRPRKRPAGGAQIVQASVAATTPAELDGDSLPSGTRLAQLGAFDSEEVAREQWDQMSQRFSVYLGDKTRVIQKATSGGRVFYRLRAMGFEDISDARRFCSALVAENADCIPVVTR